MKAAAVPVIVAGLMLGACAPGGPFTATLPAMPETGLDMTPRPDPAVESLSVVCGPGDAAQVEAMLTAINAERARLGRQPVVLDNRLTTAAQSHACDMVQTGRLSVVGSNGNSVLDRARAVGYSACSSADTIGRGDAYSLVSQWSRNPVTRDGIVDKKFDHVGIGVQPGPGGLWWVVNSGNSC